MISTHSDDLLHCVNCSILAKNFKNQLIKTYTDIKCHDKASSYIGMTINSSVDLSKIYISQQGLTQHIICDFSSDNFPATTSLASSHLFNHMPEDKAYDRIKYPSIIMAIMYVARLTRLDILLATAYLATKAQHRKEGDHKVALCIIFYLNPSGTPSHDIVVES